MSEEVLGAVRPVLAHLSTYLRDKPELCQQLSHLTRALAGWFDSAAEVPGNESTELVEVPSVPDPPASDAISILPSITVKPLLSASAYTPTDAVRDFIPLPLSTVAIRCRVKAAAAGLVAKRSIGVQGLDSGATEVTLRKQAETIPDCGLWMFDSAGGIRTKAIWDDLAGGYTVCAAAADLLQNWMVSGSPLDSGQEVLTLAAEAQSMLLYAVADVGWVSRDHEQVQMFVHIRELGKQFHIYVPRFLRREDPAEPANWPDLLLRLKSAQARFEQSGHPAPVGDPGKVRQKALGNLRFKLKKLADDPSGIAEEWPRLMELLDQAVSTGVPPHSSDLQEGFRPIYDQLPDNLPTTVITERVLRHVESSREPTNVSDQSSEVIPRIHSGSVTDGFRGKALILIGGSTRPALLAALRQSFGLSDVKWVNSADPTELTTALSLIQQPEVVAVVVTTRWTQHDFDALRQSCSRLGKSYIPVQPDASIGDLIHHVALRAKVQFEAAASEGFSAGL